MSDDYGQLVVMKDQNEKGEPAIVVYATFDQLGTCNISHGFEDTDAGWEGRDKNFEDIDLATAEALAKPLAEQAEALTEHAVVPDDKKAVEE